MVGSGELHVDPDKVSTVADWVAPRDVKGVKPFLGSANYYNRFIQYFVRITAPISNLLSNKLEYVWGEA